MDQEISELPQIKLGEEDLCISQEGQHLVVKQETDASLLTPLHEEPLWPLSDHSEEESEVKMPVISSVVGAPESFLLLLSYKPHLHMKELPEQCVCKVEEEVLTDQERNSSVKQEEPKTPQIKEEQVELCTSQEVEQHVVKQETVTFMVNSASTEENDHSNNQTLYLNRYETLNVAQKEALVNMPATSTALQATNSDLLLPCEDSHVIVENLDKNGDTCTNDLNFVAKLHFKSKTGEKPYVCPTCGKSYRRNGDLTVHIRNHADEKPHCCQTCGKYFKQKGQLIIHTRIHSDEKPYVCKTCGKGFRESSNLTVHMRIHSNVKPYICKTCGKGFRESSKLTIHMRIHTGVKPYVCQTCRKCFRQKCQLTIHMRIHSDEKPYVCTICGKSFRQSGQLTIHTRIHSDEKPYVCQTCGKGFKRNTDLIVHMRIHTGEKPYVCKTCAKRFRESCKLTSHMRTHTGEKPYVCQTCGNCFRWLDQLKVHMRNAHSDKQVFL